MKKLILLGIFCCLFSVAFAQKTALPVVKIESLPQSTEEFISLRDKIATTPEGGAAVWVVAAILYARNPTLGRQCLIIASDKSLLTTSPKGYMGFDFGQNSDFLIKQLDSKQYVPNSYVQGTKTENQYTLPATPYSIACSTNPYSGNVAEGRLKVFLQCTGADSDRPVTLVKNDKGIWKVLEFSSLVVGVKQPKPKSKGAVEGDF